MFNFQNLGKPCWNGPTCYYLSQSRCRFYHPPSHLQFSVKSEQSEHDPQMQDIELEKYQQKQMLLNEHLVKLVPITSMITNERNAWFFERCQHFYHFAESPYEDCSICLQNYESGKLITILFCKHAFHSPCLEQWLKNNIYCPLCKKDFREHSEFKIHPDYEQIQNQQQNSWQDSVDDDSYYDNEIYFDDSGNSFSENDDNFQPSEEDNNSFTEVEDAHPYFGANSSWDDGDDDGLVNHYYEDNIEDDDQW